MVDEVWLQRHPDRPVTRVGDTVRRVAGWWTPAVHDLLRHLQRVGYSAAPVPLGIDEHGREVLSYVEGASGRSEMHRVATNDGLRAAAIALRHYHEAASTYVPPPDAEWCIGTVPLAAGDIVCHGDFNPQNLVWSGGTVVGVIDWDLAYPGPALDDVAFSLIYSVPLRPQAPANVAERVTLFANAYGVEAEGLVDLAIERQLRYARHLRILRDRGLVATWATSGAIGQAEDWAAWCRDHRRRFE